MTEVALHISGNETDHSVNVCVQMETDTEKNFKQDKFHMDQRFKNKIETMKILVRAWECFFCLFVSD